jgi:NAD(P)-dependent dehydrogenase (short-subunit alcohol dehydrogenase family)
LEVDCEDRTALNKEIDLANLTGKTALVTGASRGIGGAIAWRLAKDDARVAVHYGSNAAAAKETVATIEQAGGQAFSIRAELGVDGDVDRLLANLEAGLGGAGLEENIVSTIALGRLGLPSDIADVIAFLASDDARWVTGVTIDASGGTWLGPKAA